MSTPWQLPDFDDHEVVHFVSDPATGLRAIIAVHSTHRGPGAGGVRFWHYPDPVNALTDALRLSRGMSYKNAMADLPLGGGKAVILAPATGDKGDALVAAFADAVEALGGRYVTAQDVGMSAHDMVAIGQRTRFVSGLPPKDGQAGGDPGPFTAQGVYLGLRAAVLEKLGKARLAGVRVAIQGVGSVGGGLARLLANDGARLVVADVDAGKAAALARQLGADHVDADAIARVEADVFSPNALGAVLDAETIAALQAPIVAGGANNQLATATDAQRIHDRGILYAPDYVINAGGIINVGMEYAGQATRAAVMDRIAGIPDRLTMIWAESGRSGIPAAHVADSMARALIGRR